jgi:hypothetical protein
MSSPVNAVRYVAVGADTQCGGPESCYFGITCLTAGTIGIYDGTSNADQAVYPPTALTAGTIVGLQGLGLRMRKGLFAKWTSGTFIVACDTR